MSEHDGLICAYILDGDGGGREIDWAAVAAWTEPQGLLWVHLNRTVEAARRWLTESSGVTEHVAEALLAEDTRPRSVSVSNGLLVNLRGVNLNPGADPEDMVSLRLYVESGRIISVRARRLLAVEDIRAALARGDGPRSEGEFLVRIAGRLVDRMSPVIADLNDAVDALEDEVVTAQSHELRDVLGALRRQAISLRRYLAPQRDVLLRLQNEPAALLDADQKFSCRETADQVTRYVEDLDAARERAAVMQEELQNRTAEHMNRTMYILSLVAAVFLPLSFLTGLLGINVAGIPGSEYPWAFAIVTGLLVAAAAVQLWLFRRRKML